MPESIDRPLALVRPEIIYQVREVLDNAGFDDSHVRERMAADQAGGISLGPYDLPRILRRTRHRDPLATLIRALLAGVPVPLDDFRRAVAQMAPSAWSDLGLIEIEADLVRSNVVLLPTNGFFIAHDSDPGQGDTRRENVMGVTPATRRFARSIMPVPSEYSLELGTGCGYLASKTAAHIRNVVATDLNPRAINLARFNALLNRIENVTFEEGNLFEPPGENLFDLIASNPPCVVSPRHDLIYRDSGLPGDAVCEQILLAAPLHLLEGGFALVLCNWVRIQDQNWAERLSPWFEGAGCDVWIVHWTSGEPGDYARNWPLQADRTPSPLRYANEFEEWMDYYDRLRIEAIDFGIIDLRKRTARQNWMRVDTDRNPDRCLGSGFLAGFAGHDLMDWLDDGRSHEMTFVCRLDLRVSQHMRPTASGWMINGADCVLGEGLRYEGDFDPIVFHILHFVAGGSPCGSPCPGSFKSWPRRG